MSALTQLGLRLSEAPRSTAMTSIRFLGAICVRLGDGGTLRTVGLDRAEIER